MDYRVCFHIEAVESARVGAQLIPIQRILEGLSWIILIKLPPRLLGLPGSDLSTLKEYPLYLLRPYSVTIQGNPLESWQRARTELRDRPSSSQIISKLYSRFFPLAGEIRTKSG